MLSQGRAELAVDGFSVEAVSAPPATAGAVSPLAGWPSGKYAPCLLLRVPDGGVNDDSEESVSSPFLKQRLIFSVAGRTRHDWVRDASDESVDSPELGRRAWRLGVRFFLC